MTICAVRGQLLKRSVGALLFCLLYWKSLRESTDRLFPIYFIRLLDDNIDRNLYVKGS